MLVIVSAAYAIGELCAEFGRLPPAFLPIGQRRLYELQLEWSKDYYDEIVLTLPSDYALSEHDRGALERSRVRVFRTDPDLPLHRSLCECLDEVGVRGRLDVLYGDTLFSRVAPEPDSIVVGRTREHYDWKVEAHDEDPGHEDLVWAGLFSFSDGGRMRELVQHTDSFMAAVEQYSARCIPMARREVEQWYDFGHVHTYFRSKQAVSTARHFNAMAIRGGVVTKSSADCTKMEAEAAWFESAPARVRVYLPQFLGRKRDRDGATTGYSLEYMPLLSLSDLLVFGRLPKKAWKEILRSCTQFLQDAARIPVPGEWSARQAEKLYLHKTIDRVEDYARASGISLEHGWSIDGMPVPDIRRIIAHAWDRIASASAGVESFCHGDFCFSNILYDFRAQRIKVIDPRGLDGDGRSTSFGDARYDVAKLAHSAVGLYDLFVAGRYSVIARGHALELAVPEREALCLADVLCDLELRGKPIAAWDAHPIMVLLFLSMLPLHADDPRRQLGLLANALRLFREMNG